MKAILLPVCLLLPFILFAADPPADYDKRVAESERKAVALYPESGVENSRLWTAISEEIERLAKAKSPILDDPDFPVMLAAKTAANLGIQPISPSPTTTPADHKQAVTPVAKDPHLSVLPILAALYPPLSDEGSEFNRRFVADYKSKSAEFLAQNPRYAWELAKKIDGEVKPGQRAVIVNPPRPAPSIVSTPKLAPLDEWVRPPPVIPAATNPFAPQPGETAEAFWNRRGEGVADGTLPTRRRYDGPTQRNGRPLPRNWIDPDQADANYNAQRLQQSADAMARALEDLRFKQFR